ncbi:MAG: hypothetical protein ETSY1_22800 [Candidatus Entotheonella factor]|uniref:Uncharacterized protein n=1 Tax=Entotheonella factor TaxID=1429438 RepID=W4LI58_ENTF1|nr:MAG: hypothetical protein ETSY1_22800 [Candidatus Entotheonella factor]
MQGKTSLGRQETSYSIAQAWESISWKRFFFSAFAAMIVKAIIFILFDGFKGISSNGPAVCSALGLTCSPLMTGLIGFVFFIIVSVVFYGLMYVLFMHQFSGGTLFLKGLMLGLAMGFISIIIMPWLTYAYRDYISTALGYYAFTQVMVLLYRTKYELENNG